MPLYKKKGPLLEGQQNGDAGMIPARWIAKMGVTTETQKVPNDIDADATSATIIESKVQETETAERQKVNTLLNSPSGTIVDYVFNEESGTTDAVTEELIPTSTAASEKEGIQADGTFVEVRYLTPDWSLKITRKAKGWSSRTWVSDEYVSLPPVLTMFQSYTFVGGTYKDPYGNRPDHDDPDYIHPAGDILVAGIQTQLKQYSGVYAVTYLETWGTGVAPTPSATKFRPDGFSWMTPFSNGTVPACLHNVCTISWSTGTTHPRFAYMVGTHVFPAASHSTMPGTVVIEDTVKPETGGWRRIRKTITT